MVEQKNRRAKKEIHVSVLANEAIESMNIKPGSVVADLTFGAGGHSRKIIQTIGGDGRLLAVDRDQSIIDQVQTEFDKKNVVLVCDRFSNLKNIAKNHDFIFFDAILLDLGISSWQLDNNDRGFSYSSKASLDLRMGEGGLTAAKILNEYSEEKLAQIFWSYADIERSRQLAKRIVQARIIKNFEYTTDLKDLLDGWLNWAEKKRNYYGRVWQALRMEVNDELGEIEQGLSQAVDLLKDDGRLVVISFHSKEDRLVKKFMSDCAKGCVCPKEFPECICGHRSTLKVLTKKPIIPTKKELEYNIRSHSAKMRVGVKI